ncbi:5'-methylthioadenosine/S-adenosylhomocysteine nucleosidase family protein [Flavilitoribacter nigricans]|uniref:Nucleoside phosphorylase domain-containing protein n=1 Tax=Flavilitoribacter nigricans (strain ATCC 23147 / DSM 23189 / NBRC 102662 / NCIMB 1420 / SS-2) TaxID=1122177 RepID=A0A2D0N1A5_FLAN2|nr:5'-methylthioadenosine/S-adenosylhomocysteine nucleosidase [Flavilitoribacter nigricans]PHN02322.1 hypothetical protein CRP01_33030 [Flavilitoribacter nigricans DSM 23189 = NBRC 102662]
MKVVILSPLHLELQACMEHFSDVRSISKGAYNYFTAQHETNYTTLDLIFRETGAGLQAVSQETERAIRDWEPTVVLLVGIAGSIKDAGIGDLVIASKAYGYDAGKETEKGYVARPDVVPTTPLMLELAKKVKHDKQWQRFATGTGYTPEIYFGPIAAGDKVVAFTGSKTYEIIKTHFNDTLAVEMESIGFAKICLHYPLIQCLNIRGISDQVDGKSHADAGGSQPKAAAVAAAFMRGFIDELDPVQFNFSAMELKPLVNQIMELLLPMLKMEAGKEIGNDLKEATNTTIRELWTKVKPLFIEEFEEYKEDPDEDQLVLIKAKLSRSLKKNETLQQELSALLNRAQETPAGQTIIQNSKNVIHGSNITVGGDFRLGDNIKKG